MVPPKLSLSSPSSFCCPTRLQQSITLQATLTPAKALTYAAAFATSTRASHQLSPLWHPLAESCDLYTCHQLLPCIRSFPALTRTSLFTSGAVLCPCLPESPVTVHARLLPRPSMLSQKWSASIPSSRLSTYSASKLDGEQQVLQVTGSSSSSMRACVIRPHVIWGAHDPLSTEMLLSWPRALPLVLIGDIDSQVVAVRVDSIAQYILMADAALLLDASLSGQVFNVGDESLRLGDLHARIVMLGRETIRTRAARDAQQQLLPAPEFHVVSRDRPVAYSCGCLRHVECTTSSSLPLSHSMVESFWVVIIPKVFLFLMLLVMEIIDVCIGSSRSGHLIFALARDSA